MLVNIQGHIIDTEKIFSIENIELEGENPRFIITAIGKGDYVEITLDPVSIYLKDVSKNIEWFHSDAVVMRNYLDNEESKYIQIVVEKLNAARNQLIEYWNKSKSSIPEIKL